MINHHEVILRHPKSLILSAPTVGYRCPGAAVQPMFLLQRLGSRPGPGRTPQQLRRGGVLSGAGGAAGGGAFRFFFGLWNRYGLLQCQLRFQLRNMDFLSFELLLVIVIGVMAVRLLSEKWDGHELVKIGE